MKYWKQSVCLIIVVAVAVLGYFGLRYLAVERLGTLWPEKTGGTLEEYEELMGVTFPEGTKLRNGQVLSGQGNMVQVEVELDKSRVDAFLAGIGIADLRRMDGGPMDGKFEGIIEPIGPIAKAMRSWRYGVTEGFDGNGFMVMVDTSDEDKARLCLCRCEGLGPTAGFGPAQCDGD